MTSQIFALTFIILVLVSSAIIWFIEKRKLQKKVVGSVWKDLHGRILIITDVDVTIDHFIQIQYIDNKENKWWGINASGFHKYIGNEKDFPEYFI